MSKEDNTLLGAAAKSAKNAKQKTSKPASSKSGKPASKQSEISGDDEVNLCVRVPRDSREWWASQAKLNRTSMTAIIIEAMREKFGDRPSKM